MYLKISNVSVKHIFKKQIINKIIFMFYLNIVINVLNNLRNVWVSFNNFNF